MRVKKGTTAKRKHNKILKLAKGYRMSRRKQFKKAMEAVLHAGEYAFSGRKLKKRMFRQIWNIRINAFARENNTTYSRLIHKLRKDNIQIDRKVMSYLAMHHPKILQSIIKE